MFMKSQPMNNIESRNVSADHANKINKESFRELLNDEYIRYLVLFIIIFLTVLGSNIALIYKINNLETNILNTLHATIFEEKIIEGRNPNIE